jgi:hypothetical protein
MSNLPMLPTYDLANYLRADGVIESTLASTPDACRDWLSVGEPTNDPTHSLVPQWFVHRQRSLATPSTAGLPVCRNADLARRAEPQPLQVVTFTCKDTSQLGLQTYRRHYVTSNVWDSDDDHHFFDQDLVFQVLFDVNGLYSFTALPEINVSWPIAAEMLPATSVPTPARDRRSIDMLESRQQRDAIVRSRDFRSALRTLVDEEQFSNYDLSRAIGISPGMLVTWRARPLDKLRQVNEAGISRLLFTWKYWLHVTQGDTLGRYLRHTPQGTSTSLLDLLTRSETSEEQLAAFIEQLARYASQDRLAAAARRRAVGGLPDSIYRFHASDWT